MPKCKKCGYELKTTSKFCPQCGEKIVLYCPHCSKELSINAKYCSGCGKAVEGQNTIEFQPEKILSDFNTRKIQKRKKVWLIIGIIVGFIIIGTGIIWALNSDGLPWKTAETKIELSNYIPLARSDVEKFMKKNGIKDETENGIYSKEGIWIKLNERGNIEKIDIIAPGYVLFGIGVGDSFSILDDSRKLTGYSFLTEENNYLVYGMPGQINDRMLRIRIDEENIIKEMIYTRTGANDVVFYEPDTKELPVNNNKSDVIETTTHEEPVSSPRINSAVSGMEEIYGAKADSFYEEDTGNALSGTYIRTDGLVCFDWSYTDIANGTGVVRFYPGPIASSDMILDVEATFISYNGFQGQAYQANVDVNVNGVDTTVEILFLVAYELYEQNGSHAMWIEETAETVIGLDGYYYLK